jgi:hypothetical protein
MKLGMTAGQEGKVWMDGEDVVCRDQSRRGDNTMGVDRKGMNE